MRGTLVIALAAACGGGSSGSSDGGSGSAAPDPRFKWVGAYSSYATGVQYVGGNGVDFTSTMDVYSPAAVGSGGEALVFDFTPPPGLAFTSAFSEAAGSAQMQAMTAVATSLAFTSTDVVLTSAMPNATTTAHVANGGSAGDLAGDVATAAASGYVTTAIGFDGTQRVMASYADSSVTATYDTTAQTGDITEIATMASAIAGSAYVITAFGQVDGSNFGMVGARESGWTATHDAMTVSLAVGGSDGALADAQMQGYVVVGGYFSDPLTAVFVLER
ncbi:MAG TPA: hypothetical protein VGG28_31805 [Kofleriaceae bacterium]|jgi:hypothetical protein